MIIHKGGKFDHISPAFKVLHWLPVEHGVSNKTLLLTQKPWIAMLWSISQHRYLHLEDRYLCSSPRWWLRLFGKWAFVKPTPPPPCPPPHPPAHPHPHPHPHPPPTPNPTHPQPPTPTPTQPTHTPQPHPSPWIIYSSAWRKFCPLTES